MLNYFKTLTWPKLSKLLWVLILTYIILVFGICLFKYFTFSYNALDLAIFNQVFYNSSLGNFFQFTIHPTLYLGDHFELIIFLLVPFYSIFKSPLTLLFLQTLFLALATIPLYLIAKRYLSPLQTLLVIALYLFNPATLNINLFEFHILALSPFFIFWTFYFYDQNKFTPFIIFVLLSLLIREDVAFIIFMLGLIAILDKKGLKWIFVPFILASFYFFTALKIISYFSSAKTYKFLVYYQWLGQSPLEIFKNFFLKFPLVWQHLFTLANFEFILGFFLIFLFIPFYRPKYLLLALGMFLQIMLGFASGELILRTHYGSIFLTALSIATIFSLQALAKNKKVLNFWQKHKDLVVLLIITGLLYNFLVLGPVISFVQKVITTGYQTVSLKNEFIKEIPKNASLVTTYDLITNLSSRKQIYSLNYLFLGRQQYSAGDYKIPLDTQYLLINFEDFFTYYLQYKEKAKKYYEQGDDNLRKILLDYNFQLKKINKNLALFEKDFQPSNQLLYQIIEEKDAKIDKAVNQKLNEQLEFLGLSQEQQVTVLFFKAASKIDKDYFLAIDNQLYPLGFGLFPTSTWPENQIVKLYFYNLPQIKKAQVIEIITGGIELNGLGSTKNVIDQQKIIGNLILD